MGARECPVSARSWRTSVHREISRRPPNCSDGSGRSWDGVERALEAEASGNR